MRPHLALALAALLAACTDDPAADAAVDAPPATCEPLDGFEVGDPDGHAAPLGASEGEARAGRLAEGDLPDDPTGLLGWAPGDFVLANARVAVVVEDVGASDDFNPHGGQPIGVALMEGGAMTRPALFGEPTFTFGSTTLATERVSVIADGSDGGPAVVRAEGGVERLGFLDFVGDLIGGEDALGLRVALDYVLEPDAEHVEVRWQILNDAPERAVFRTPLLVAVQQNRMPTFAPQQGFGVGRGLAAPWVAFVDERGASYALEPEGGEVRFFLEQSNFLFLSMPRFDAAPCARTERSIARVHVGGPGLDGVFAAVARGRDEALTQIGGTVTEASGEPAPGARVFALDAEGVPVSRTTAAADGSFTLRVPAAGGPYPTVDAVRAWSSGRPPGPAAAPSDGVALTLPPAGQVTVRVTDEGGAPLGARVQAIPTDAEAFAPDASWGERPIERGRTAVAYAADGVATLRLPHGAHALVVSRGYEHEMERLEITVSDAPIERDVTLAHSVPTPGVMCGDFHIHTHRSFDAEDDARLKVRAAAAEGLEIPARSEHEWIRSFEPLIAELGLTDQLFGVTSLELTTFVYGHFGVFPLDPDPGARNGGAIEWVDRPAADVLGEARAREGAEGRSELIINHPRAALPILGWFTAAGYDPETGTVANESVWVEDFVLLEVFNDSDFDANEELVADWFSFLSRGRRVMAVGSSDSHEVARSPIGYPRTCIDVGVDTAPELRALGAGHVRDRVVAGASTIVGGVFVEAAVGEAGPGETAAGVGDRATVDAVVRAPSWVTVDRLRVYADGALVETVAVDASTEDPLEPTRRFVGALEVPVQAAGSWVVLVADGEGDLAPVHPGRRPFGVTNPIFLTP